MSMKAELCGKYISGTCVEEQMRAWRMPRAVPAINTRRRRTEQKRSDIYV
jgi:hypothetical protein